MNKPSYSITNTGLTVVFSDGRPLTLSASYKTQYAQALDAIRNEDWSLLKDTFNLVKSLGKYLNKVQFKDGTVTFNGKVLNNIVTKKIMEFWVNGLSVDSLVLFLENCLLNPSQKAVEELYLFLEKNNFTLTEDGCFLCWRKVDSNYKSYHPNRDGTYNTNYPGDVVKMDRSLCTSNREVCNDSGLHACAFDYLSQYQGGNGKVVLVKINPKNVISVPIDHANAKLRCCEYEVIQEVETHESVNILENKSYFSTDKNSVKYYNNRGANGRFVKL